MTAQQLWDLLEGEPDGVGVMWYSGRGMFGRECLAITGTWKEVQCAIGDAINEMHRRVIDGEFPVSDEHGHEFGVEQVVRALLNFSFDNFGQGVVLYFPDVSKPEEEDEK